MFRKPQRFAGEQLFGYGLKLLSARGLSEAELRSKLQRRAADENDVEPAMRRLKEMGLLNDSRFAESFALARLENQGFGKSRVIADLAGRRIPRELAAKAVEETFRDTDETELIRQFLERKYRGKNLALLLKEEKHLASAYRKLRQAGFSSGVSIRVLKKYSEQADLLEDQHEEMPDDAG
jgi:regulatory protein